MDASVPERATALLRARWRWLAALALVLLAWALAGFLWVPRLARHAIEDYVRHDLGRRVAIGHIAFNPFTLVAEVRDFALAEADGTPVASFALLRVDAEAFGSLVHRAWTLRELRLEKPVVDVRIDGQGRLNLAALVPAPQPGAPPPPARRGPLPAVRVGLLSVEDGSVGFQDRSHGRPFAATLAPIHFRLNDFRTTPAHENAYHFDAETLAHEKLGWSGHFTVQPLGSDGEFSIAALRVATLAGYLRDALPVALPSGSIDLAGRYQLRLDGTVDLDVELPRIALHDLALAPRDAGADAAADAAPWIRVPTLELDGTTLSLAARRVHVDAVRVADAGVTLWRDAAGFNLGRLVARAPAPAAAAPAEAATAPAETAPAAVPAAAAPRSAAAPAWDVSVARIALSGASVDFEDRTLAPAAGLRLAPIDAQVSGYVLGSAAPLQVEASVGFDGHGRFSARGQLAPAPLAAELELDLADFELPPLQPWVGRASALTLERGSVRAHGQLALRPQPKRGQSGLAFRGDVAIARLLTRDAALHEDLIGWEQLELRGIDFGRGPDHLAIDTIRARQPYGRVVIGADRTLNIARVLAGPKVRRRRRAVRPPRRRSPSPQPRPPRCRRCRSARACRWASAAC
ncbi:MAG: DUF748 domain-containing protein [Steroidobacteraceae bacterium]